MSHKADLGEQAKNFLEEHLGVKVNSFKSVAGGHISAAFHAITDKGEQYFVKGLADATRTFEREAYGLELLAQFFRVPKVMATSDKFLVLEWIESGHPHKQSYHEFGMRLAKMHRHGISPTGLPGFPFDNTIGATLQLNENKEASWPEFYWTNRLAPQLEWAREKGHFFSDVEKTFLRDKTFELLGAVKEDCLSLIHGDLWGGNHKFTKAGEPWIFDPSCYYGHREAELAMMRLFSGYPKETFIAYEEEFPLEVGWDKRQPLYQLYHVLNHVNLFGGSYFTQAKGLIKDIR